MRAPGLGPVAMRENPDRVLRPRPLSVHGVGEVIPVGGEVLLRQRQPDIARVAEFGITHDRPAAALRGLSANTCGGRDATGSLPLTGRQSGAAHRQDA
ncbi:MAG: hypothetical protein JNL87_11900 [Burkholderiaceae bacterium]|nr:hypothetical protein [Burkholderiaceae bacterium]